MTTVAFNLANFKGGTTDGKVDGKYPDWVTPGGYVCVVTGLKNSADIQGYTGSPYISFTLMTECGKQGQAKFWAIKETDSPKSKEWKQKQLKEFLMNCGVKDFSSDENACKDALNKRVQVAFNSDEYVGRDKDSGLPVKRTITKYTWSSQIGKKLTFDAKYNKTLSPEDLELVNGVTALKEKFDTETVSPKAVVEKGSTVIDSLNDEDLPF